MTLLLQVEDGRKQAAHFVQDGQRQSGDGSGAFCGAAPVEIDDQADGAAAGVAGEGVFNARRQENTGASRDGIAAIADGLVALAIEINEALAEAVGVGLDGDGLGQMPMQRQLSDVDTGDAKIEFLQDQWLVAFHWLFVKQWPSQPLCACRTLTISDDEFGLRWQAKHDTAFVRTKHFHFFAHAQTGQKRRHRYVLPAQSKMPPCHRGAHFHLQQ